MSDDFIEIHWTSESLDEARRISRFLIQKRLVACAQIIPWVESVFLWNNEMETAQESKIVLKTRFENYEKIKTVIEQNCKYEVPEILWFKIEGGNEAYMNWLGGCLEAISVHDAEKVD
jgi:periplasmic divalent cation tolerance protein